MYGRYQGLVSIREHQDLDGHSDVNQQSSNGQITIGLTLEPPTPIAIGAEYLLEEQNHRVEESVHLDLKV